MMQAALNTLKEERLAVAEARRRVQADVILKLTDPGHRRQLLHQMGDELVEHDRAIALIEQMMAGPRDPIGHEERHAAVNRRAPPSVVLARRPRLAQVHS